MVTLENQHSPRIGSLFGKYIELKSKVDANYDFSGFAQENIKRSKKIDSRSKSWPTLMSISQNLFIKSVI